MELLTSNFRSMPGFSIGHRTQTEAKTGSTVLLFENLSLTAVDVRGAAPGTRELDLLQPGRTVKRADAIVLTGGSAFGLHVAQGVMDWLNEAGRGFATPTGPVPIVPTAVIYDLAVGEAIAPDRDAGYRACRDAASTDQLKSGSVGAGTGAAFGTIAETDNGRPGGVCAAQVSIDEGMVMALAVVNAFGAPIGQDGIDPRRTFLDTRSSSPPWGTSTTLMACVTDVPLDHDSLVRMTVAMHDGLARTIAPAHTMIDGDVAFATSLTEKSSADAATSLRVSIAAELATESAIASMVSGI